MATEVKLPQLGQTMEEGTIVNCLINCGDEVKKGDVIFEIETDKATLEMESPAAGFVKYILAEVGQTLPVGEAVLILGDKDEEVAAPAAKAAASPAPGVPAPASIPAFAPAAAPAKPAGRIIASPRAKKVAKDMGVDLTTVTGTGPGGRIIENDVKKAAAGEPAAPAGIESELKPGAAVPLNRLQKITAQKMLQSKQQIPCFYLSVKVDMTELVELRTRLNKTSDVKISYNDFIMRAVALGLKKFPIMTGQLADETINLAANIGIGLAIAVPGGLVAPIIKDVDKKSIVHIAGDSKALIEKARSNKLAPADLQDGCITVSNLGAFGIEAFIPIVVPGQCSILGVGQITDTCVPPQDTLRWDSGNILVRKLMSMILSVDHKVANGTYAAQFLDLVRKLLEDTSTFV